MGNSDDTGRGSTAFVFYWLNGVYHPKLVSVTDQTHQQSLLQPLSLRWNNLKGSYLSTYFGDLVLLEKFSPIHPSHALHTASLLLMRVIELIP